MSSVPLNQESMLQTVEGNCMKACLTETGEEGSWLMVLPGTWWPSSSPFLTSRLAHTLMYVALQATRRRARGPNLPTYETSLWRVLPDSDAALI